MWASRADFDRVCYGFCCRKPESQGLKLITIDRKKERPVKSNITSPNNDATQIGSKVADENLKICAAVLHRNQSHSFCFCFFCFPVFLKYRSTDLRQAVYGLSYRFDRMIVQNEQPRIHFREILGNGSFGLQIPGNGSFFEKY